MDISNLMFLGLGFGGVLWFASGVVVFFSVWYQTAYPLWGKPGALKAFTLHTLFAAAAATLPGGTLLATAALVYTALPEGPPPPDAAEEPPPEAPLLVPDPELIEGCR